MALLPPGRLQEGSQESSGPLKAVPDEPGADLYRFGDFRLDPVKRLLFRRAHPVPLPPKALELLLLLVGNANQEIRKDDLVNALWPDRFVEESNLSQYVFLLRKALGQTLEVNRFILTIPGRGYRFVAAVTAGPEAEGAPAADPGSRTQARSAITSIAVLPFHRLDRRGEDEYLGLGMADALITRLSHIGHLAVRPTDAILKYGDHEPLTAGRELGVDSVLTGRFQREGERIRVTAQLVRVSDGSLLWAEQFDESCPNVLAVQDSITDAVVNALTPTLSGRERERLLRRHTESPAAHQAYLKGRYYSTKWTQEGWRKGIQYFNEAITADPDYAQAHAGLAECHYIVSNLYVPPREAMPRVKEAALKALQLDETLAEAHTSLGLALAFYDWEWTEADREFRRAIALNPGYAAAHLWYGRYLATQGQSVAAVAELRRGQVLDPLSPSLNAELGRSLLYLRQYDAAIRQLQETLELHPTFWPAHLFLGWAYEQKGLYAEAVAILGHASALDDNPRTLASLGHAYGISGRKVKAQGVLRDMMEQRRHRYVSPYDMAAVQVSLGEMDEALAWLEKACEDRSEWLVWLKVDPRLDGLRLDPRFARVLAHVGLA